MDASTITFCAAHFAAIAGLLFCCYLWGELLIERLLPGLEEERLFLNTSAGIAVVIVFLFCAAAVSQLNIVTVGGFVVLAPVYLLYRKRLKGEGLGIEMPGNPWRVLRWFAAILLLAPLLFPPLFPPTHWDEISYHLPYARFYVNNHGLGVSPFLRYPLYAHNIDLLYSLSLLFYDDILAHLFHAACAVVTAVGIYYLGKDSCGKVVGIVAALIFISSRSVIEWMQTSYIDLGLTLFVFSSFYCIAKWSLSKQERWLYLAGFFAAIALGSKYSGWMFLALLLMWVVLEARKVKPVLKFLAPALAFGLPWYIRNIFIAGDPLTPFGGNTFGFWLWNKADLVSQNRELGSHGTERTFHSFLAFPWNVVFHPELFRSEQLNPGVLALFPSFLALRWLPALYRKMALYVLVHVLLWFFSTQIVRYLLPTLPMIALLISAAAATVVAGVSDWLASRISKRQSVTLLASAVPTVLVFLALIPAVATDVGIMRGLREIQIPVTQEMRAKYLAERVPCYEVLQRANEHPELPVYQFGFENCFYYANGKIMGDWFGPARYSKVSDCLDDPAKLHEALTSLGAKRFIINKNRNFTYNPAYTPYLEEITETAEAVLYAVK